MNKKWHIASPYKDDIIGFLQKSRGIDLAPADPSTLLPKDVGIDKTSLKKAIARIKDAIEKKESIVVYADYDADGITAGAIMWETLWGLGARVMPYIPHRVDEGYGLSEKGIDAVKTQFDPTLIITVDHGITAHEKVAYAKKLGIDVIVTDHHVKSQKLPDCVIVHTTQLAGSGISWFVAYELSKTAPLELAAIGTIADLVPLIGPNRSIAKFGLAQLRKTKRVGIVALLTDAGIEKSAIETYTISHMVAPRINAMGRLEHALDALRLLCTKDEEKAKVLAQKLSFTNRDRQKMTEESVIHALNGLVVKKLIFISHASYNQGIIGLIAGKLVEAHYRPAIVVSIGEVFSKASARSISGFNIVEAIRTQSDLLIDVGGHPMAAGFTVETANLKTLQVNLEAFAEKEITDDLLIKTLKIDMEIPLESITQSLWKALADFAPFGIGNPEPVFATRNVTLSEVRLVGKEGKHLKFKVDGFDAIAFGFGALYPELKTNNSIDIAYCLDMNEWNGSRKLQLKVKDIQII